MCLMESWPALEPCKGHEASNTKLIDRLVGLPHDVLLRILSFCTVKEVARTRLVSKRWETWLLRYFPKLHFQKPLAMKEFWEIDELEFLFHERSDFVKRVDRALKEYLDASIDEFRVTFDLDESFQHNIDKWVAFAFAKQVKKLELDFALGGIVYGIDSEFHLLYRLQLECFKPLGVNHTLASLCLKYVNITSQVVESLLQGCPNLENFCIENSECLTNITSSCLPRLKHLDVSRCPKLQMIDISAPTMTFFRYYGEAIELKIRNAFSLSRISIGGGGGVEIVCAFEPLSQYFLQLEVLSLQIHLYVTPREFDCHCNFVSFVRAKRNGSPLKCLKTLELFGYRGHCVDFEIAIFVLENVIKLQEVVVDVGIPSYFKRDVDPCECVKELREKIPRGVKFVLMNSDSVNSLVECVQIA